MGENADAIMQCRTEVVQLSDSPQYLAVSYAWGDDTAEYHIMMDEKETTVRRNLYDLLRHLQSIYTELPLWIDALCITQTDVSERNHQVNMMGSIFGSATRVIVWLGVQEDGSDRAMQFLLEHRSQDGTSATTKHTNAEMDCLHDLCGRIYWTRTWIIQEIVLGQAVELHCGTKVVPWEALMVVLFDAKLNSQDWSMLKSTMAYEIGDHKKRQSRMSLAQLLEKYQTSRCHDPRDKVYALLNLAADREKLQRLRPDYNKSLQRLYVDVIDCCSQGIAEYQGSASFHNLVRRILGIEDQSRYTHVGEPPSYSQGQAEARVQRRPSLEARRQLASNSIRMTVSSVIDAEEKWDKQFMVFRHTLEVLLMRALDGRGVADIFHRKQWRKCYYGFSDGTVLTTLRAMKTADGQPLDELARLIVTLLVIAEGQIAQLGDSVGKQAISLQTRRLGLFSDTIIAKAEDEVKSCLSEISVLTSRFKLCCDRAVGVNTKEVETPNRADGSPLINWTMLPSGTNLPSGSSVWTGKVVWSGPGTARFQT
jgi:hypothetical protein